MFIGALALMVCLTLLEMLLWLPMFWKLRKPLAWLIIAGLAIGMLAALALHIVFATILLTALMAYRLFNLARILKGRINPIYLQRSFVRTSMFVVGMQIIVAAGWYLCWLYGVTARSFWVYFAFAQLAGTLVLVISTERHLRTTLTPADAPSLRDKDLPTLTVAIPARNETEDLEACLQTLVASDYPKLEIIVLDDCSQNKRTPEIIRGFAHDGVRFLKGDDTKENWLAKNQAYQQLLDAANGEYIVFAGVDTRFETFSLRRLVESMLHKKKTMMSIIPANRQLSTSGQNESLVLQPVRYAWELSLPRKLFNRPPVLSTCWVIATKTLKSAGGFAAVSRSIVPESYFARVCTVHDGYSFMQSNETMGVKSVKQSSEQFATAIRTRYPQLHRRPELVLLMTVAEILGLLMPFALVVIYLIQDWWSLLTVATMLNCILILFFYGRVVCLTYRKFMLRGFVAAPFAAAMDIFVLNYSMARYEFSEVIWKGRNVCIPVMRVIPKLPDV